MTAEGITLRTAGPDDAAVLADLVRTAYRGSVGWTTEAAYLTDERIDAPGVLSKILDGDSVVLVGETPDGIVACCEIVTLGGGLAQFGLFAVRPDLQDAGLGRRILAAAEDTAVSRWACDTMEMQVVGIREELIAWYERRGYRPTGQTRPFPYDQMINGTALRNDLYFTVLSKRLH